MRVKLSYVGASGATFDCTCDVDGRTLRLPDATPDKVRVQLHCMCRQGTVMLQYGIITTHYMSDGGQFTLAPFRETP